MTTALALNRGDMVWLPWLREHCAAEDIKLAAIARFLGIDQSVVYLWSVGRRPVPHYRLEKLAAALKMSVDTVLEHAQVTVDQRRIARPKPEPRPKPAAERVRLLQDEMAPEVALDPEPAPWVSPSVYPLRWCFSRHGGEYRRHHHGPDVSWAPRVATRVEDMA